MTVVRTVHESNIQRSGRNKPGIKTLLGLILAYSIILNYPNYEKNAGVEEDFQRTGKFAQFQLCHDLRGS